MKMQENEEVDDESERKMTLQEKIYAIDHEIRLLHQFCKQSGCSAEKIYEFAQPFVDDIKKEERKHNLKQYLYFIFFGVMSGILLYAVSSHPFCQAVARLVVVQFYPLYQWIHLYKDECLIKNPLFLDQYITEEDCELCSSIDKIVRTSHLTEERFINQFLQRGQHVIVEDGIKDWPESLKSLTLQTFIQEYEKDPAFYDNMSCDFNSNMPYGTADQFIAREKHIKEGYFVTWSNCAKPAAKALRRFYKRPHFLPSSVETFEKNFVFFSKRYKGEKTAEFKPETAIIILQQVKGRSKFYLSPEDICNRTCVETGSTLQEGEILIAMNTHKVWILDVQGTDEEESITIGIEGNYN